MMLDLSVVCCPIWKSFLICCFKIFFRGFKFHKLNKLNRAVNVANDDVVETSKWGEHKVKNFFVLLSNPTDLQLPRQVLQTSRNCLMFALINAHHTWMPRRSYTSRSAIEAAIAECKIDREVKLINEIHFKVIVKVTERFWACQSLGGKIITSCGMLWSFLIKSNDERSHSRSLRSLDREFS